MKHDSASSSFSPPLGWNPTLPTHFSAMSLEAIAATHEAFPPESWLGTTQVPSIRLHVPDLIGVKDRHYLDRTGLQQQRCDSGPDALRSAESGSRRSCELRLVSYRIGLARFQETARRLTKQVDSGLQRRATLCFGALRLFAQAAAQSE